MKRFLIEVVVVFVIALLPLYIIQYIIDNAARKSHNPPYSSFNMIYNDSLNADIVIFGNSRAQCHYNTILMDSLLNSNCYNLGLSGYSFDYMYHLQIIPYLKNNINPRLIILEVGPQAFFSHWSEDYNKEFLPFLNISYFNFYIRICDEISWVNKVFPTKYFGWGFVKLKETYKSINNDSKYLMYKDCYTPCPIGKYIINFPDSIYEVERDETIIQNFKDFIKHCNDQRIPLLLVCSPMHKADFYDNCKMQEFWKQIDSLTPNIPKLDYSLMYSSDTLYFKESTHLNEIGAELFTIKLAHDIDSLGLLKE